MNRIKPALSVDQMTTYVINAPLSTHFEPSSCEEIGCPNFLKGWAVGIIAGEEGAAMDYACSHSGKEFQRLTVEEARAAFPDHQFTGCLFVYIFSSGQPCFDGDAGRHLQRIGRPEVFLKVGGDWRGFTSRPAEMRMNDWLDDFEEHQDKLATVQAQGA